LGVLLDRDSSLTQLAGYVLYIWSTVMGWSNEEIQVYIAHLRRQVRDRNVHAWYRQRVVYGRKPEASKAPT
jgi:hypothetical protein